MWITDCKYFHIFSKCAISGIYHSVDGGRFPRSYRICYFCSRSAENKQNKWRTWLTVHIATYSVLTDLRDAIFAWLCACPEWSLWRSISVSKQVCMCLQLPSPTCGTQLGPSPVCLVSIGDLLRLDLRIQRAGFGPWSKCRSGNNNLLLEQSSRSLLLEAGPSSTLSPRAAGHEVTQNVTGGFRSDSKVKWKVYPCLNHEGKLLVLAEYLRKNGLS